MTTWTIPAALLAALILFASLTTASADNSTATNDTRPDDAAWVEDCPPDMMCAMGMPVEGSNETEHEVSHDGNESEPIRFGPDDCIECSYAPVPGSEQDNTTWGTDCPEGVYCMYNGNGSKDPDSQPVNSTDGDNAWVEDCPEGMVCAYDDDGREPDTTGNGTEADPIRGDAQGNMVPGIGVFTVLGLSAVMAVVGALAGPEDKRRRR